MILRAMALYCEEEHGPGDVTFPENNSGETVFDPNYIAASLRQEARNAGWRRIDNHDYCSSCVEGMIERGEIKR